MQTFTVKSNRILKEGVNEHGPWTQRVITFADKLKIFEENGTPHEFTSGSTFDDMAAGIQAGDQVEAEAKIEGKYLNLKKLNKVGTAGQTPQAPASPANPVKEAPAKPIEVSGQARGMAVKEIGDLIRASRDTDIKLLTIIFADKAPAVMAWYRKELLGIAGIE